MKNKMKSISRVLVVSLALAAGCASSYTWRTHVPEAMRTISVSTFPNETDLVEVGALATRQVLRELQREGTFKLASADEAALEIQGVVKSVSLNGTAYSRRTYMRFTSYQMQMTAQISVIDKVNGKVLVDNKFYTAHTTLSAGQDSTTAERDASGRLADDLARQVVDDILNLRW